MENAEPIVVPFEQLSPEALDGLIEAFIAREGTDYGAVEMSMAEKVEQVRAQLRSGEAVIVFDLVTETCTILPRAALREI